MSAIGRSVAWSESRCRITILPAFNASPATPANLLASTRTRTWNGCRSTCRLPPRECLAITPTPERYIALARELETPRRVTTELHNLGYVDLHDAKLADARADFREALLLAQKSRDELMLRYSILDGAIVALADRPVDDATRLLGAA